MTLNSPPASVDLLILGGGWTYTFLEPLLVDHHSSLTYAATTRDGRGESIKWTWDETMQGQEQYEILPRAKTVIIVFPIKGVGGSKRLVERYEAAIGAQRGEVRWIQLGSSGIWDVRTYDLALRFWLRLNRRGFDGISGWTDAARETGHVRMDRSTFSLCA